FLKKIGEALSDRGICVVQTSQAAMLSNGEFDTIYHEHCSFFTESSFRRLAARAGLSLRRVSLVNIHGISFVFVVTKTDFAPNVSAAFEDPPFALHSSAVAGPELHGGPAELRDAYGRFGNRARERMAEVGEAVAQARSRGRNLCFVGAAAKAITFMRAAKLEP